MKTYAIYVNSSHVDTITAYTKAGALAHFMDDNPSVNPDLVSAFYVVIP